MTIARRAKTRRALDLTPLIDCIFQLLLFFLLSSTFIVPRLRLTLPQAPGQARPKLESLVVAITPTGQFAVNGVEVARDQLSKVVADQLAHSSDRVVAIYGAAQAEYAHFVFALAAIRAAGANEVTIAHQIPNP